MPITSWLIANPAMKRTALLLLLLAGYGGAVARHHVTSATELDPVSPQAREIERALAEEQYEHALPLVRELQALHPNDPLVELWLALIYGGLHRFDDEAAAWQRVIDAGADVQALRGPR